MSSLSQASSIATNAGIKRLLVGPRELRIVLQPGSQLDTMELAEMILAAAEAKPKATTLTEAML